MGLVTIVALFVLLLHALEQSPQAVGAPPLPQRRVRPFENGTASRRAFVCPSSCSAQASRYSRNIANSMTVLSLW